MASLTHREDIERTVQSSIIDKLQKNVNKNVVPKLTTIGKVGGIYCHICEVTFSHKKAFTDHYKIHGEEEVIYTCVVCHKQTKVYASFRAHCYSVHVVGNKNRCHHCYKAFSNSTSLDEHIKANHSQPQQFQCSVCLKKFKSQQEQKLHQTIHDNKDSPPYNCQICNLFLPTLDNCKSHAEAHTVLIYHCPICNENINKQNAKDHLKKHFDSNSHHEETTEVNIKDEGATEVNLKDKNAIEVNIEDKNAIEEDDSDNAETSVEHFGIACDFCTVVFKSKLEFDDHFSEDHEELVGRALVYVCVVCKKKFDKYRGFSSHVYNHAVKAKFSCNVCHKRFKRLSALATHTGVCAAGAPGGKPFACSECGHRYSLESSVRKHLRDTHGIHRVHCPVDDCGQTFATMKELVVHQYHHKSEQAWCRRCGMRFTSLAACEQHLEVHRQTLHSCPVCSRDYPDRSPLMNHIMQHFETLILMCKICGKVFDQRRRFLYHMETHNAKQTHVCSYCNKGFMTQAQLRVHLNTHTGSKPYKCAVCHKAFGNLANLSKHKRRMHMKPNSVTLNRNPTSDAAIYSENLGEDELKTSDVINKNNNLNTPTVKAGSNQRKRPQKIVPENKIYNKRPTTFDFRVNNNLESINDDEALPSDTIAKYNNFNTPEMDKKLGESKELQRQTKIILENKISKLHPTSNAKAETHSRNFEEDKFIIGHGNLKEPKMQKVVILDIQNVYYPIQNKTVKQEEHIDMEPEPIDRIDLEKELQLIENTSKNADNQDAVYGDVLSNSNTVFDYVGIEALPTTDSSDQTNYPQEYGPEFPVQDCGILNLDDHMLPHIDPLLTIKTVDYGTPNGFMPPNSEASAYQEYQTPTWEPPIYKCPDYNYHGTSTYQEYQAPGWEPPIFTKVCPEYTYYGDMADSNRPSMMNTDIF